MLIGDRLKEARLYAKMSQKQLSQTTGISQQKISKYERNIMEPGYSDLCLLVNYLNMGAYEVLNLIRPIDYGKQMLRYMKSACGRARNRGDLATAGSIQELINAFEKEEHLK